MGRFGMRLRVLGLVAALVAGVGVTKAPPADAAVIGSPTGSYWVGVSPSSIELSHVGPLPSGPYPASQANECQNVSFEIRTSLGPSTLNECAVTFGSDMVTGNGAVLDGKAGFFDRSFVKLAPDGRRLGYYCFGFISGCAMKPDVEPVLTWTSFRNTSLAYVWSVQPTTTPFLKDASGNILEFEGESMAYSGDGRWLVSKPANATKLFITDLRNPSYSYPFDGASCSACGFDGRVPLAVSHNGRYVARGHISAGNPTMTVYDMSTCVAPSVASGTMTGCSSTTLTDLTGIAYADRIVGLRFYGNDTISFLGRSAAFPNGSATEFKKYTLHSKVGDGAPTGQKYRALGDSFSSGEGAATRTKPYEAGTDSGQSKCHRSPLAYPSVIKSHLGPTWDYRTVACSGATTANMQADFKTEMSQLLAVGPKTRLITLTAGGNDAGFADIIGKCTLPSTCYSDQKEKVALATKIRDQVYSNVSNLLAKLKERAPQAAIYIAGYPKIVNPGGDCGIGTIGLNGGETYFADELVTYLNYVVERAAVNNDVRYVDISEALHGHRLCDTDTNWVNGLRGGNDTKIQVCNTQIQFCLGGPWGNESFHPNWMGQTKMGDAFITQVTKPGSDPFGQEPNGACGYNKCQADQPKPDYPSWGNPSSVSGGVANIPVFEQYSFDSDPAGVVLHLKNLKPGSTATAKRHSVPVTVGTSTVGSDGRVSIPITMPADGDYGVHELRVDAVGPAGNPVIAESVGYYVGPDGDRDADGIPDGSDLCQWVPGDGGDDGDGDGIGDDCDPIPADGPAGDLDEDGLTNQAEQAAGTSEISADTDGDSFSDGAEIAAGTDPLDAASPSGDTTAPTVTGTLSAPADGANGWFKTAPTITWASSDPAPTSGAPTVPPSTVANQQGAHTYTSGESCDPNGNCSTGSLDVSLDSQAPEVSVTAECANPCRGNGTTLSLTATDAASGLASVSFDDGKGPTSQALTGTAGDAGFPVAFGAGSDSVTVAWTVTDGAGNVTSGSSTVAWDNSAPVLTSTVSPAPNAAGWTNAPTTVHWAATDDGGLASVSPDTIVEHDTDGVVVNGQAVDYAGNTSSGSVTVKVDQTAPTGTGSAGCSSPCRGEATTVAVDAADATSGLTTISLTDGDDTTTKQVSGGSATTSFPVAFDAGSGTKTVTWTVADTAGNTTTGSVDLAWDNVAPTLEAIITPTPDSNGWTHAPTQVQLAASDDTALASVSPDVTVTDDTTGTILTGTAVDAAGNTTTRSVTVKVDQTAPTGTGSAGCSSPCRGEATTVTVDAADATSGLTTISLTDGDDTTTKQVGGGSATTSFPVAFSAGSGTKTVTWTVADTAGNTTTGSVDLAWDNVAPTLTPVITPAPNGAGWSNAATTVHWNASDDGQLVSVSPDTVVSQDTSGTTVTGTAVDAAGNTTTKTVTIKLDRGAPNGTISPTSGPVITQLNQRVRGTATDTLSGVEAVEVTMRSGNTVRNYSTRNGTLSMTCNATRRSCQWTSPTPHALQTDVTVTVTDLAGNRKTLPTASLILI